MRQDGHVCGGPGNGDGLGVQCGLDRLDHSQERMFELGRGFVITAEELTDVDPGTFIEVR